VASEFSERGPTGSAAVGDSAPIVLEFELDEEDMVAYYRAASRLDPAVQRQWDALRSRCRGAMVIAAVLLLGMFVVTGTNALGPRWTEDRPVVTLAIGAGVVGAIWTAIQYRRALAPITQPNRAYQYARSEPVRFTLGSQAFEIGAAGIVYRSRHQDVTQRWSGIAAVRDTPDGIYLQRRDRQCYVIPKRIFQGPDEAASVVRRARAWLDEAGHGDARRIRTHLAEQDVPCPGCRYNLRGAQGSLCPECGRAFDTGLLR
jgi:hypothetical protein